MTQVDSSPLSHLLDVVLSCLPLHAEEGTLRESLTETELMVTLGKAGVVVEASALLVALLRRQLEALALLDRAELAHGRWAFVSFPASLLGRLNPSDLSDAELAAGPGVLRQMFDVASPLADAHLDNTLTRELFEELGLHHEEDYGFERWQRLPPYRQVAGVGNRHAYSEYGFQLYTLKLTAEGEVRLLDREAGSKTLTWFSAAELAAPQRADGASAFVDVLHAAWGGDVAGQLSAVPDSGASKFALDGESNTLDLPASPDAGFRIGKPGKERVLPLVLEEAEWHLLLMLGWHARGFVIHASENVRLLGGGWVRVADDLARIIGCSLLAKMEKLLPLLVEMREGHYNAPVAKRVEEGSSSVLRSLEDAHASFASTRAEMYRARRGESAAAVRHPAIPAEHELELPY